MRIPILVGAVVIVVASACGRDAREQATALNAEGLRLDAEGAGEAARGFYRRAAALGVAREIPLFNAGRSEALDASWSEAHDRLQEALRESPRLPEARYADGWVLFSWGRDELAPEGCELASTGERWQAARRRFDGIAPDHALGPAARENLRVVDEALAALEARQAACRPQTPPPPLPSPPPPSAPPPPPPSAGKDAADFSKHPPPPAGGGGLSGSEREEVEAALDRVAEAAGRGRAHRRTQAEQLPPESWQDPEEVWW